MSGSRVRQWRTPTGIAAAALLVAGVLGAVAPTAAHAAGTPTVAFPADSGVVNVKTVYGAKGDGVTDDTTALMNAFTANDRVDSDPANTQPVAPLAPRTVFLPAGTYLVSRSLQIPGSTIRVAGAGDGATTIKLKDGASGFGNASSPQPLLKTGTAFGGNANAGFANYVMNLTLDVGARNPGADGLDFWGANVASAEHLVIKSSDPSKAGARGLVFDSSPGPLQVKDVTVDGFDTGVWTDSSILSNDLTLVDLTLTNQRQQAVLNQMKNINFENLTVSGSPVAIRDTLIQAVTTVVGGNWTGTGGQAAAQVPAGSYIYVRGITATGYSNLITTGTVAHFVGKTSISEWASQSYWVGKTKTAWTATNPVVSLNLPIKPTPEYQQTDLTKWANVTKFGATPGNNNDDDAPAVQKAIDSGAEVIYFPYGFYTLKSNVIVRGNVRKVDFLGSAIDRAGGTFQVQAVNSGTVVLENGALRGSLIQNGPSTVAWRNIGNVNGFVTFTTGTSATGDLFVENAGPHAGVVVNQPIHAWVRQLNREVHGQFTITNGATVWNFGDNIEDGEYDPQSEPEIITNATFEQFGGVAEILGGNEWPETGPALHQITNSRASILMPGDIGLGSTGNGQVGHWLSDIQNGVSVGNLVQADVPQIGATVNGRYRVIGVPMYVSP